MEVRMISHTPNPEKLVYLAARTCYYLGKWDKLIEEADDIEHVREFIKKLIRAGHHSVLEHASFSFLIKNISRVCLAQLTRHRLASFSVRSHRRSKVTGFILPKSLVGHPEVSEEIKRHMEGSFRLYEWLLEFGLAAEDARFILPQAVTTDLVMTANARELRHVIELRMDKHAQWEIRELASKMLDLLFDVAPSMFEDLKEASDEVSL